MIGFQESQAPHFFKALAAHERQTTVKKWVYVPYDQLNTSLGPVCELAPSETGIILIESLAKGKRRPYHQQKLALILCNQRHFALEQAQIGYRIHYAMTADSYANTLQQIYKVTGQIHMMEAAEYELRKELEPLIQEGVIRLHPNETWLTQEADFDAGTKGKRPWRMDLFYQYLRRKTNILMENGKPVGGKYSLDGENRKPWKGTPPAPQLPRFQPDPIALEAKALIEKVFHNHIGTIDLNHLPCTQAHAESLWRWVQDECLVNFGPYEDAMSTQSKTLFHSCLSPLINLNRLLPKRIINDVLALDLPLSSKEGFIRQVLGWREFMRHVHRKTHGFRRLEEQEWSSEVSPCAKWGHPRPAHSTSDGGSLINALDYQTPLPEAFWGKESGLNCLDHVVNQVMETGFTHHIPRLMVLANIATLLEIQPREITDWFWVSFIDAYDWVVEPNVLGMGTYATGPLFTTKPYIAGSNYINKMSDFCKECAFHPKKTCPITRLYWAFLERHKSKFKSNFRLSMILRTLDKRSPDNKALDAFAFEQVRRQLGNAQSLTPESLTRQPVETK
ncbi:MAG: cryptochrome/photolyase family protein [Myxococcota bacterium]